MPEMTPNAIGAAAARPTTVQEILERQNDPRGKNIRIARTANDHLDKNSFLKLLVTQLSKQDPMAPVNDREFIAQMAQFSSLEQMNNVANSMNEMKSFQANFLVGREISGKDFVSGREVNGTVDRVIYDGSGQVLLRVSGRTVRFEDINSIGAPDVSRETNEMAMKQAIAEYMRNQQIAPESKTDKKTEQQAIITGEQESTAGGQTEKETQGDLKP